MTAAPDAASAAGYGAVFAVREFRPVFASVVVTLLGDVVANVALSLLVYRTTGSPLLTAVALALGLLPYALGGTLLSGVADRFPVRRVLVGCDLVSALCAALMALPGLHLAVLMALRCTMATAAPVFSGARAASLADILEGDRFVLGRSLVRIVAQSAQIVGYGAGGLLLVVLPPRAALGLTSAGFLVSAALLRFGTKARPARAGRGGGAVLRQSLHGMRTLFLDRRTRALLLLWWMPPAFVVMPEALAAPYADRIGRGPAGLGLLMAALPVGAVVSELLVGSRLRPAVRSRLVLPLAGCALLPLLLYAVEPGLVLAALLLAAAGAGQAYTLGLDQWFVRVVPEELLGRAMTLMSAGLMTVQGLGMAAAGAAAEFAPPHMVVVGAAVTGTGCVLLAAREYRASIGGTGRAGK